VTGTMTVMADLLAAVSVIVFIAVFMGLIWCLERV